MSHKITKFQLWRIELPAGRVIGDWMCSYSAFKVLVLALDTSDGLTGWGYGVRVTNGQFSHAVPWRSQMPSFSELHADFEEQLWTTLNGLSLSEIGELLKRPPRRSDLLATAARGALWDLQAKELGLPLHRLLGPTGRDSIRAYASHLEFHLSAPDIQELCQRASKSGLSAIKVKVGHPDLQRDIDRLKLIQGSMPDGTEIAIDANTAWTAVQTIQRIESFTQAGIDLAYLEDPLPLNDVAGYELLNKHLPIEVVGHDYATDPEQLRPLLDVDGLRRLRIHSDLDFALEIVRLADEYKLPVIVGNMLFELGVHAAAAFERVERIEFSNLAWNKLPKRPVCVKQGQMVSPQNIGTGLDPKLDLLEDLSDSVDDDSLVSHGATER